MAIKSMIGLEAEYLLFNPKGELIVPPATLDRDGYPVLGEIRGDPGKNIEETLVNFFKARVETIRKIRKGYILKFLDRERVPLKIYKEANRQVNAADKEHGLNDVRNIYGTDISDFSDQIMKANKIQGVWISCGLHIHFSCEERTEKEIRKDTYEPVHLPIDWALAKNVPRPEGIGMLELTKPTITLFREMYNIKVDETLIARASRINKPTLNFIVSEMDKKFFNRFAPKEDQRTKYRQPGFYEVKPYGFEYRSLPANDATIEALPEIVEYAFSLLNEANTL
jgi:hypothetical protein